MADENTTQVPETLVGSPPVGPTTVDLVSWANIGANCLRGLEHAEEVLRAVLKAEQDLVTLTEQVGSLTDEVSGLTKKRDDLQRQIKIKDNALSDMDSLVNTRGDLNTEIVRLGDTRNSLANQVASLRIEMYETRRRFQELAETKQAELVTLEQGIATAQAEFEALKNRWGVGQGA